MIIDFARSTRSIVTDIMTADDCPIEPVSSFKLLGITLSNDLRWSCHVRQISVKANKHLHFLKLLKRSAMTTDDLLYYYKTVIRPVIEYACPVWQSSLTVDELQRLKAIQKQAVMIISGAKNYAFYCLLYKLERVNTRLDI